MKKNLIGMLLSVTLLSSFTATAFSFQATPLGKKDLPANTTTQEPDKTADKSQPPQTTKTTESPGIAVGETLPEIKLKKQGGTEVSIQELLKTSPVAIVFFRSASW